MYRNVSADASSANITDLDKDLKYRVVMLASTEAGSGIMSEAVIAELYTGTSVTRYLIAGHMTSDQSEAAKSVH